MFNLSKISRYSPRARGTKILIISIDSIAMISGALSAFYTKELVDGVIAGEPIAKPFVLVLLFLTLSLFSWWAGEYVYQVTSTKATISLQMRVIDKLLGTMRQSNEGEALTKIISDCGIVAPVSSLFFVSLSAQLLNLCVTFALFVYLNPYLALVAGCAMPLYFIVFHLSSRKIQKYSSLEREKYESFITDIDDVISGSSTIKVFNSQRYFLTKLQNTLLLWFEDAKRLISRLLLASNVTGYIITVIPVALFGIGMWMTTKGMTTTGVAVAFLMYLPRASAPIMNIIDRFNELKKAYPIMDRIDTILDQKEEHGSLEMPVLNSIEFCDVSFSYGNKRVLSDVSFSIRRGEWVGLVGSTGAGKTTIAKMILGLLGEALINGVPAKEYSPEALRKKISYVEQKPYIFNGSIRENISLGVIYSDDELAAVCDAVCIDFARGNELDSIAKDLSDGQKQRIGIARALIRKPDMIIFDEAFSSIDSETEKKILENMRPRLSTALMISHRLSTLMHTDRILVLSHGKIIAEGKHEMLVETSQEYRDLFRQQRGTFPDAEA
jgi:ABC-type multidrug transport system fused ATPase/permease subunit